MGETGSVTVLAPVLAGIDLLLELFLMSCVTQCTEQLGLLVLWLGGSACLTLLVSSILRNTHTIA